jgi:hypothetical protein
MKSQRLPLDSGGFPSQGKTSHKVTKLQRTCIGAKATRAFMRTDKRIKLRSYKATSAPTYILLVKGSTR